VGLCYRSSRHVLFQNLGEEVVLLNLSSGMYFGAGSVGAKVWKLASEGTDPEEIVAQVVREFDTTTEQASIDVSAFLVELERHLLLERHDS